jgi:hypothetical protein
MKTKGVCWISISLCVALRWPALAADTLTWPPALVGRDTPPVTNTVVTDTSAEFLRGPTNLAPGVAVARTVPTVDFMFFPEQNYPGNPWSVWGDSVVATNGKYYASIGDHFSANSRGGKAGNAFVFEYDPQTKRLETVVDLAKTLNQPSGTYTAGKIHSRLDIGDDGCVYFATHRGSEGATIDKYNYKGDWILRFNPATRTTEVISQGPVEKHCIPASVLDPKRLIFYGGTASGSDAPEKRICFFAYDITAQKLLYSGPNGCQRYFMFSRSTGCVYYEKTDDTGKATGELMRYDPAKGGAPESIGQCPGIRSATQETPQGLIFAVSNSRTGGALLWSFDPKTLAINELGPAGVATQQYITSIDADPAGRYLYYIPGAHGGSERDGSPVVQFDVKAAKRKIIAFLNPFYRNTYGFTTMGSFSSAIDPRGETLFIAWHGSRSGQKLNTCALTVVHIPESERQP